MDAKDLREMANTVTDREALDIAYNEFLLPILKKAATNKAKRKDIDKTDTNQKMRDKLRNFGLECDLQYLCRGKMLPYLEEKGFRVAWSAYSTTIYWD